MSVVERIEQTPAVVPAVVTAADVLTRAADLLEEFGWCQGQLGSKADGHMCIFGAFDEANRDLGVPSSFAIRALLEGFDYSPIGFNNAPGRTKAEVVAKLREAAEAAR